MTFTSSSVSVGLADSLVSLAQSADLPTTAGLRSSALAPSKKSWGLLIATLAWTAGFQTSGRFGVPGTSSSKTSGGAAAATALAASAAAEDAVGSASHGLEGSLGAPKAAFETTTV